VLAGEGAKGGKIVNAVDDEHVGGFSGHGTRPRAAAPVRAAYHANNWGWMAARPTLRPGGERPPDLLNASVAALYDSMYYELVSADSDCDEITC
jgi:hypothetical protein